MSDNGMLQVLHLESLKDCSMRWLVVMRLFVKILFVMMLLESDDCCLDCLLGCLLDCRLYGGEIVWPKFPSSVSM